MSACTLALLLVSIAAGRARAEEPPEPPPPDHVPRIAVLTFRGTAAYARAAEEEIARALEGQSEIEVVRDAAFKERLARAGETARRGWTKRDADVRRILEATDIDFVLVGRMVRDGGRDVLVAMVRAKNSGKVVSAVRVERAAAGLGDLAVRMTQRLRKMAFAAVGLPERPRVARALPSPVWAPKVATPIPTGMTTGTKLGAAAEVSKLERLPAETPRPVAPRLAPAAVEKPSPDALPVFEARLGIGGAHIAHGPITTRGGIIDLGVTLFPATSVPSGWRGLGFDFGLQSRLYLARDDFTYLHVRPSALYRFFFGEHYVDAQVGYEFRRVETVGQPASAHMVGFGGVAVFRLSRIWRVSPSLRGLVAISSAHSGGLGLGIAIYAQLSAMAVGAFYRAEGLYAAAGVAGAVDDTLQAAGAFLRYRF